jgi:hypothetical protein
MLPARQEMTQACTAQAGRLRARLLAGDDTDRRAARTTLPGRALAALAGREVPAPASREQTVRQAGISRLARALAQARSQLKDNRARLLAIVDDITPGPTSRYGAGPVSAAQAIVSFSHPGRCRLNRGGDRALNRAIHAIALVRMRSCPRTRAYVARRTAEGKTTREIRRCPKRYIARELYRHLTRTMNPPVNP